MLLIFPNLVKYIKSPKNYNQDKFSNEAKVLIKLSNSSLN